MKFPDDTSFSFMTADSQKHSTDCPNFSVNGKSPNESVIEIKGLFADGDTMTLKLNEETSPSISMIASDETFLFLSKRLLKEQLWKLALVFGVTFSFIYLMTLEMVFIDNRSLDYVYGVTTPAEWRAFAEAVRKINMATNDEGPFPIALLRPSFGGAGYEKVLNFFPETMNISTIYNGGILLPMDVVISSTQNLYIEWRAVADTVVVVLFVITAVFIILVPFIWRRKQRGNSIISIILLRRLVAILGLNYFFRGCVLGLTILPPGSLACIPKLRYTVWEKLSAPLLLIPGIEACCYDFMYSGHTSFTTVLVWFWIVYLSGLSTKFSINQLVVVICTCSVGALIALLMIFSLTISRLHYSIDVALGLFIGSAAFWAWHTTLCLYHLSSLDTSLKGSYKWFISLIGWIDGINDELLPSKIYSIEHRAIASSSAISKIESKAKSRSFLE